MVHTNLRKGEQLIASLQLQVKLPLIEEWIQAHWQLLRRLCMSSIKQQTLRIGTAPAQAQAPSLAQKEAAEQRMYQASPAAEMHSMMQKTLQQDKIKQVPKVPLAMPCNCEQ